MQNHELTRLQELLEEGQRLSGQYSYKRRAPNDDALPYLLESSSGLRKLIRKQPELAEAWRLLSYAEECLLNYLEARQSLERFLELSGSRDRKHLKRLALLKQCERDWAELKLSANQLEDLGDYLDLNLQNEDCDHTYRLTEQWLQSQKLQNSARILRAFEKLGGVL